MLKRALSIVNALLFFAAFARADNVDPLPSWNEGAVKHSLLRFVREATRAIAPEARVAVFDNDGTLWSEQPMYVQMAFALDRVRALAPEHPEWHRTQPFKAVLENDRETLAAGGETTFAKIIAATHAGMTDAEFTTLVQSWIATARHPRFHRLYTELVYRPMLELLALLKQNGFHVYVVSGGGVEFMRAWTERVYGIPPENILGSASQLQYEVRNGQPVLIRLPEIAFIDDGPGKPIGIERNIGRRPIFAAGNSDGDREMLEWTTMAGAPRLGLLIHHTDAAREWAYDRNSPIGRLDRALDEAPRRGWIVVDMKRDWNVVYP